MCVYILAKPWENKSVDVYDCRKRSWYIETATCSKDIVILLDNSGSMTGYRNFIAQLTVKSILDTFSNNDFMNIYNYSKEIDPLVPCFNVIFYFKHFTIMLDVFSAISITIIKKKLECRNVPINIFYVEYIWNTFTGKCRCIHSNIYVKAYYYNYIQFFPHTFI